MGIKRIWWLDPRSVLTFFVLLIIGAYLLDSNTYNYLYKTEKGIDLINLATYVLVILLIEIGICISMHSYLSIKSIEKFNKLSANLDSLKCAFDLLLTTCIMAYLIWFINTVLVHGNIILDIFRNISNLSIHSNTLFFESTRFSGITTFTELGPLVSSLGAYLFFHSDNDDLKKEIKFKLALLLLFTIIRAFLFSERVAFISSFIPVILIYIIFCNKKYISRYILIMPIIGIIALFILFGVFEYFRSWNYYQNIYDSFLTFIYERLTGYYYCAINTECLYINNIGPSYYPVLTVSWIYKLPFIGNYISSDWSERFFEILNLYGNPEFNNMGGILAIYNDYGIISVFVYIVFGYFLGIVYKLFTKGTPFGVITYPFVYYTLLEMPRFFGFGNVHFFFFSIGIIVLLVCVNIKFTYR